MVPIVNFILVGKEVSSLLYTTELQCIHINLKFVCRTLLYSEGARNSTQRERWLLNEMRNDSTMWSRQQNKSITWNLFSAAGRKEKRITYKGLSES